MLSRVIAKNVGDVFFETQCTLLLFGKETE